jgi:hypothetical protein
VPKVTKNQTGLGQVAIIIIVLVGLAVVGLIVWSLTKSNKPTNSTNTANTSSNHPNIAASPAESSACLQAYNDSALCAFAEHMDVATLNYEATGTATSSTGTTSSFTIQNDGKGDKDMVYSANGKQISYIILDGQTYIQDGSGTTWLEYTGAASSSADVPADPTSGFTLNFQNSTPASVQVTKEGTATCGSLTCYKYKVIETSAPTTTTYVYFDTSSYLLRQWTYSDSSDGAAVNLTFTYPAVVISKPSPVQQINT